MFIIKTPKSYPELETIEKPFRDLSLSYRVEQDDALSEPLIVEGKREHVGKQAIEGLIQELRDYYGAHYNCSCAR
ncbi:hypothetical protein N6H18_07525 [Reichenbachiella agarivorans]|uniref:Uncharacterized protein n=1 Tax=Reichenbachiella agarivorans TaxID=2979464 RepID=A0ABY6CTF1_9BACT|nr:hypothetical protein [Reichenbachiella agarivorans]UXP33797.1 hypothetical protein N6H18_07525 [Reichenbachiella agarivorans]